jgi:hypothetical protein
MAYLGKELIGLGIEPNSVGILELDVGSGAPGYSLKISSTNTLEWGQSFGDNITEFGVWENSSVINAHYTVGVNANGVGNNALSAGPITIAAGSSITLPAESTWVIA